MRVLNPNTPNPIKNGISNGESLAVTFNFNSGHVLTEAEILNLFNLDTLNLAFHLQTITANGYSEFYGSCVGSCDTTKVPEPGTITLLGAGMIGLGLARRRRQRTVLN